MKLFKKFFTILAAMALVISMGATEAKAEKVITTSVENAEIRNVDFFYNALAAGIVEGVYGARVTIIVADESVGFGGAFVFNSTNNNWNAKEWGNADAGKAISAESTGNAGEFTLTRIEAEPIFDPGEEGGWAEVAMQSWWGSDFEVTKVELLDASGNVLGATAEESTEEAAEETEVTETEATAEESPKTGDNSNLAIVYIVLAAAFVGFIANLFSNKKKSFQ